MPKYRSFFHRDFLCTKSKAFQQSINTINISVCHSLDSSIDVFKLKINLPGWKPCCSSLRISSILNQIHFRSIWQRTLVLKDCNVMPHRLLQSGVRIVLKLLTMTPFLQSLGTIVFKQIEIVLILKLFEPKKKLQQHTINWPKLVEVELTFFRLSSKRTI